MVACKRSVLGQDSCQVRTPLTGAGLAFIQSFIQRIQEDGCATLQDHADTDRLIPWRKVMMKPQSEQIQVSKDIIDRCGVEAMLEQSIRPANPQSSAAEPLVVSI